MKKGITIAIIVLLALGLGYYLFTQSPASTARPVSEQFDVSKAQPVSEPRPVEADERILGNKDAKNTMIVYEDFQCPACASYAPVVKSMVSELRDTRVVFRHYPLFQTHRNAIAASYAAEAAGAQGKFWEMYETLYRRQEDWSNEVDPTEKLVAAAQEAGIPNIDQFRKDVVEKTYKSRVERDYLEAYGLQLPGTPTLVFNGKQIDSRKYSLPLLKQEVEGLYK